MCPNSAIRHKPVRLNLIQCLIQCCCSIMPQGWSDSLCAQDTPRGEIIGMYTGQLQTSKAVEELSASAEGGVGYLAYDKGEGLGLQACASWACITVEPAAAC